MSAMQTEPSGQKQVAHRAGKRNRSRKCLPQAIFYTIFSLSCCTSLLNPPFNLFYFVLYKPLFSYTNYIAYIQQSKQFQAASDIGSTYFPIWIQTEISNRYRLRETLLAEEPWTASQLEVKLIYSAAIFHVKARMASWGWNEPVCVVLFLYSHTQWSSNPREQELKGHKEHRVILVATQLSNQLKTTTLKHLRAGFCVVSKTGLKKVGDCSACC